MPDKLFDVIIVGAGPAGLACARELAVYNDNNKALSVLILDKRSVLGSKPCGGGICEKETEVPIESGWSKKISKQEIIAETTKIKVNHRYKRITFEREDLASYQERLLVNAKNVTLLKNVLVKKILQDAIETDRGTFRYRNLVGADGAASMVRANLKLPVKLAMGMYYKIWGQYDEFVAYYDLKKMGPGYIWEFPHPAYNNIGIYYEAAFLKAVAAKKILQEYLEARNYKFAEQDFLAAPVNFNYLGYQFENIYLAGDAGGFTSRMHGGGMTNAVISGTEIAKIIKDPAHDRKVINRLIKEKLGTDKIIDYYDKLPLWLSRTLMFVFVNLYRFPFFQKILPV